MTSVKKILTDLDAFSNEVPAVVQRIADAIPFNSVPDRMKYTIAVSEMVLYASHFRRNILHWNGSIIPINSISFVITASGQYKDSSVSAARACFASGYKTIDAKRQELAKQSAIKRATEAGVDNPQMYQNYKEFYRAPNPLFAAPSTNEGLVQHINDLANDGIGGAFMYSGEFGAELTNSKVFQENLQLIAEIYDMGNKDVKLLKGRENQSSTITSFPMTALFAGSQSNILYDETIKKIFRNEFTTKFARRSNFCFIPEDLPVESYNDDTAKLIAAKRTGNQEAIEARQQVSEAIDIITTEQLKLLGKPLDVDEKVFELFVIYENYNAQTAETISKLYPISTLVRKHMQWKALKLAGAIAIFYQHDKILESDYLEAIRFCEMLDKDMTLFEIELAKEPYEIFADYMKSMAENNKAFCSVHELRKLGYIPASGNSIQRLKELCYLAASYDQLGVYTYTERGITYERIIQTDQLTFSFKPIDISGIQSAIASGNPTAIKRAKGIVGASAAEGLEIATATFEELANILTGTFAYSPFEFRDGKHHADYLIPTTKWLVFDVDKSHLSATEAHQILIDINHHIALTADASNEFKFRIFVELDSAVELNPIAWRFFYESIANELGLTVDILPQSQMFYSYGAESTLSVTDGSPVYVRDHVMYANDKAANNEPVKPATKAQLEAQVKDPYTTFNYAYECRNNGAGSRTLIRAAKHAKDLKFTKEQIIALMQDINDYWVMPMDEERFEKTILTPISRWTF